MDPVIAKAGVAPCPPHFLHARSRLQVLLLLEIAGPAVGSCDAATAAAPFVNRTNWYPDPSVADVVLQPAIASENKATPASVKSLELGIVLLQFLNAF